MRTERPHETTGLVVLLIVALLVACAGCCGVPESYVKADRLTLDTVGKDFKAYVEADEKLPDVLKALKIAAVEAWRVRVDEAEKECSK